MTDFSGLSDEEEEEEEEEPEDVPELVYDDGTLNSSSKSKGNENNDTLESSENNTNEDVQSGKETNKADPAVTAPLEISDFSSVSSDKLKVPSRLDWYNSFSLPTVEVPKLDRFARERLLDRAKSTLDNDNKTYLEEFASNTSQKKFLSQILTSGTLNDKISALTLLIQEAPMHNIKAMETLLGYCEKKSRTAALQSITAMKDLLLNGLLPDRKLLAFDKQPLTKEDSDSRLAVYFFEDMLKKWYFKFIQILEKLLQDSIVHVRMSALTHTFDLLSAKPEQEVNLLKLGVNKLGDMDNKVSAKASYSILQLQQAHPAMKKIIVDAVIDIIFQSNNDDHSKYYGVTTLNQTIITRKEVELANTLVKTYFALFEKVLLESNSLSKDGEGDKSSNNGVGKSEKGRHNNRKNFKKGKKGGRSVKKEEKTEHEIIEEKNTKMFSALLTGLNRAFPFSELPNDVFQVHLDTLFKITHSANFNTAIQALVLINHIVSQQKINSDRYYRTLYESLLDSRLVNTSKQGIYLNLLYKSLKHDKDNVPRVLAFVKRIMQVILHWLNVGAIAGMLFLLIKLSKTIPEVFDLLVEKAARPDEDEESEKQQAQVEVQKQEQEQEPKSLDEKEIAPDSLYDPKKRDPTHANAQNSSLWEINQFLNHYHPTVAIYASSIIDGTPQPKPDLGLYTLAHFLDRFVYKNAKQKAQTKGSSIMQPLGGTHTGDLLVKSTNVLNKEVPANTENWLNKKVTDIKADERFFHQYFTTKVQKIKNKKVHKDGDVGDVDIDDEIERDGDMDDEEVWKALVKSKPDVEDDISDGGFSDFDEADFSDMDDDDDDDDGDQENDGEREAELPSDLDEDGEDVVGEVDFSENEGSFDEDEEDDFDEEEREMFNINQDDEFSDSEVDLDALNGVDEVDEEEVDDETEGDSELVEKTNKKRSRADEKDSLKKGKKSKRQRVKDLPLFASPEDYAQYLE